jgi:hypothetical protein
MGYNLAIHGVLAKDSTLRPTNYREPLPPIVLAAYFKGIQWISGAPLPRYDLGDEDDDIYEGPGAQLAKGSNIFWGLLFCFAVFVSVNALTHSFPLSAAGTLLLGLSIEVDTLLTELPAAALLVLASFF